MLNRHKITDAFIESRNTFLMHFGFEHYFVSVFAHHSVYFLLIRN